jgi:gp178
MNKQELIEQIKGLKNLFGNKVEYIEIDTVIELASKLDEPQKPAVPQFVADWYEEHKDNLEYNIWDYVFMFEKQEETSFKKWFNDSKTKPFQTLVNMHQFGYTVEKEKRYTIRLKYTDDYLVKTNNGDYRFYNNIYTNSRKHTRKEIEKARFGWVFDCKGIEVKEVE